MTSQTKKTRILLLSDTHTSPPTPSNSTTSSAYRAPLPKSDILLHAGDITKVGYKHEHEEMLAILKDADAELKLVIAGNHDITLDEEYYNKLGYLRHKRKLGYTAALDSKGEEEGCNGQLENCAEIKALYTNPDAIAAGIQYLEEGLYTFTLSNGTRFTVYASPYTPEFCQWAFPYERNIDRYNLQSPVAVRQSGFQAPNPIPSYPGVDIMLTHGPPYGIFDEVVPSGSHVGCENLLKATTRAKPRLHVFGHIHEAYGGGRMDWGTKKIEKIRGDPEDMLEERCLYVNASDGGGKGLKFGEETLFVNASVVTIKYHAVNAPWLVDLDLPVEGE
ncbi:metallophosphatase domain-containing protein [Aspergillus ruber CBS 135680]|uniref:Ser/Thr protein phosphatase family protein n=1 Tax=Aspergillus ruber (strain CBS 135680) TaxID=1388766 RepID=A0A017SCE8_ASPRC|nr:Ser/Thr protein phosphatase family protein [Aspergillus ruber CBS 135680]EYE94461.1 Ser/Thr protein phosphatase family protein [Aspergillus ruber CBS 135680]